MEDAWGITAGCKTKVYITDGDDFRFSVVLIVCLPVLLFIYYDNWFWRLISLCDCKLNIFVLWTKQDIWKRQIGMLETLIDIFFPIFWHFKDQTTGGKVIDRITGNENSH